MSTLAQLDAAVPSVEISDEGWEYQVDDRGVDASMRFIFSGADIQAFVDIVAGKPPTTISIGGQSTTRYIPLQHPDDPNAYAFSNRIYAPSGSIARPTSPGTFSCRHDWYFADVRFRVPLFRYDGEFPGVTIQRDRTTEMRTAPGTSYLYPSDGLVQLHDVGIPVQIAEYTYTFHGLVALDNETYDELIGCVNIATFLGKPPGTILYRGCSSTGILQVGGVPSYTASHQFAYSRIPHRMIMRPDGGGFEAPVWASDPDKYILDEADLTALYG